MVGLPETVYDQTFVVVAAVGTRSTDMIGPEVVAEIMRLYVVEKWRPGTIARHLGIHRDTVKNALRRDGRRIEKGVRASKLDPFEGFVRATFEKYPKVPACQ